MCLAVLAEVLELLPDKKAVVGMKGVKMKVSAGLLDKVKSGDFVLIHAGFAITIIDENEAKETLDIMHEIETINGMA